MKSQSQDSLASITREYNAVLFLLRGLQGSTLNLNKKLELLKARAAKQGIGNPLRQDELLIMRIQLNRLVTKVQKMSLAHRNKLKHDRTENLKQQKLPL